MAIQVHPSSIVSPQAELGEDVQIGPFCIVEADSKIGARTRLLSHVVIGPHTQIGEDNVFYPHVSAGMPPQDLKYSGAPTRLVVGDRNIFRECVTLHRGTETGTGVTIIGSDNFIMVNSHVAHDCRVGDRNILANTVGLAGHVHIGDGCTLGAVSGVHQFCRVGDHAFLGAYTVVTQDALPFMKTVGSRHTKAFGVNSIGLRRKGFSEETVEALKQAYRILFHQNLSLADALQKAEEHHGQIPEVAYLLQFIREAKRGIHRG